MRYDILVKSRLFSGFSVGEIEKILDRIIHTVQSYQKNETVFQPMETADRLGMILKGCVQSYKLFPNGNQVNVSTRGAGDMIGSAATMSAQRKYPFLVTALERTEVLMFKRDSFLNLLQSDRRLFENFLMEMSTITYMLQQRLELMSYHGIGQKVAFFLLAYYTEKGVTAVTIPGSMTKWALMMNVSRPSLYRELRKMEEKGLLKYAPPKIEILDPAALEEML